MSDYNYDNFSSKDYDFNNMKGPSVGGKAPNCLVFDCNGKPLKLLDFDGQFLVLEMGSLTCPLFQTRRHTMASFNDSRISSAVLYVREAHPGMDIPQHKNFEDKRACAERLRLEDGETRQILVDDFEGGAHRAYGGMPNTVFIINRQGCVVFRSEWNNPKATINALKSLMNGVPYHSKSYFKPGQPSISIWTLRRAGKGAVLDFLRSFPSLIWHNLIKRNLRLLFNRPKALSDNVAC